MSDEMPPMDKETCDKEELLWVLPDPIDTAALERAVDSKVDAPEHISYLVKVKP